MPNAYHGSKKQSWGAVSALVAVLLLSVGLVGLFVGFVSMDRATVHAYGGPQAAALHKGAQEQVWEPIVASSGMDQHIQDLTAAVKGMSKRRSPTLAVEDKDVVHEQYTDTSKKSVETAEAEEAVMEPVKTAPVEEKSDASDSDAFRSLRLGDKSVRMKASFENKMAVPITVYWVDFKGAEFKNCEVQPGDECSLRTFVGHAWRMRDDSGAVVQETLLDSADQTTVVVTGSQ